MPRVLIPIDGSTSSLRAVQHVVELKDRLQHPLDVLLINVQPPIPQSRLLLDGRPSEVHSLEAPLKAHGAELLAAAGKALDAASIRNRSCVEIGDPAPLIAHFAETNHCELIAMGTRGLSDIASLVLGSVARKVLHLSNVPVLMVP
ncbi:MAG: universal stress protein [Betaproteobacteria bacterium]|nr:universal stress protein [Betaproteobacteria bacterium]